MSAIGMELKVRQMSAVPLQHVHGLDRRRHVPRHPQIVLMQVHRVWQAKLVDDACELHDDLGGGDALVAFYRLMQLVGVLPPLPRGDPSRIDRFDAIGLCRPQQPAYERLRSLELAGFEQVQHHLVVGHQQECRLVDDGNVVHLLVGVFRGKDGHSRFVHGRPSHPGVQVAGSERRRCQAADARAKLWCMDELPGEALVFWNEAAGEIQGASGDVSVHIDAAGEDKHAGRVDRSDSAAGRLRNDTAIVCDENILDDPIDAVGGIVNAATGDSDHALLPSFQTRSRPHDEAGC